MDIDEDMSNQLFSILDDWEACLKGTVLDEKQPEISSFEPDPPA